MRAASAARVAQSVLFHARGRASQECTGTREQTRQHGLDFSYKPGPASNLKWLHRQTKPSTFHQSDAPATNHKVKTMKTKLLIAAVASASLMGLTACGSNPTNQQVGTGVGAVAGGLAGAAVGGTGATILGAGAGALIGNEVGRRSDNNQRRY